MTGLCRSPPQSTKFLFLVASLSPGVSLFSRQDENTNLLCVLFCFFPSNLPVFPLRLKTVRCEDDLLGLSPELDAKDKEKWGGWSAAWLKSEDENGGKNETVLQHEDSCMSKCVGRLRINLTSKTALGVLFFSIIHEP